MKAPAQDSEEKSLEERLYNQPIAVPENPLVHVGRNFVTDQLSAMGASIAVTTVTDILLAILGVPDVVRKSITSVVGPLAEKPFFFLGPYRRNKELYRTLPPEIREEWNVYKKRAISEGIQTCGKDILHDIGYTSLMAPLEFLAPSFFGSATLYAAISYILPVFGISLGEYGVREFGYWNFKRKIKKIGFEPENYVESRFYIDKKVSPQEALDRIAVQLGLDQRDIGTYQDLYFSQNIPDFSGRTSKMRLRKRKYKGEKQEVRSMQVVFTRAVQSREENGLSQFNYFPQIKNKLYHLLPNDGNMPNSIDEIEDERVREFCSQLLKKDDSGDCDTTSVKFDRMYARNKDVAVTVDNVLSDRNFYVLEIKAWKIEDIIAPMRRIMYELPVITTMYGKQELVRLNGGNR
ncbi:hypothetical protein HZA96_01640 [Candidatus Woesearchaeota archaeon]|nr:hypothetical protein [Candidatus Woesearchaeota archaeon]